MKIVWIIAIAFVLFIPTNAFSEIDFRYQWVETWERLGSLSISYLRDIVIDSSDNLYVIDSNKLIKLTTDNQKVWTVDINPLVGLFLNQNDEIFVPVTGNELRKYSPSGDLIKTWNLNTFDTNPNAILNWYVDKDETIYVSERFFENSVLQDIGTLKEFDSAGNLIRTYENIGLLKFIDDNYFYTAEFGKVAKHDLNGNKIIEYGKQEHRGGVGTFFQQPVAIITDPNGIIFATGGDYGPINIIDQDGDFSGIGGYGLGEKNYGSPRGIALDSENTAYILDNSRDKILVFERLPITIISQPESESEVAQSTSVPVPEPEPVPEPVPEPEGYTEEMSEAEKLARESIPNPCVSIREPQIDPRMQGDIGLNNPQYMEAFREAQDQYDQQIQHCYRVYEIQIAEKIKQIEMESEPTEIVCGAGTILKDGFCIPERETMTTEMQQKSSNGGCLIATATFGSELAPQVQQLREIRDNSLLQTESGRSFMESFNQFYYSFSPVIADLERENPAFKEAVKIAITPMISSLSILNYVDMDSEVEVLGYGISLIILNLMMYVGIPIFAITRFRKW